MRRERSNKLTRQIVLILLSLFLVSFAVFTLSTFSSGDISLYVLGETANSARHEELVSALGNDRPFLIRYLEFLKNFFTLNWGNNIQGYPIRNLIFSRSVVTLEIMVITLLISILLSLIISMLSVRKEKGVIDHLSDFFLLIIFSLPSFSLAIILMLVFSIYIPVFPTSGFVSLTSSIIGNLRTVFLPSLSLALMHTALYIRVLKKSLKREMRKDYITGSRSRGKREGLIILTDALPPASLSLIALSSQSAASLIAGSAVTETVFSIPGLGSLIVSASLQRDTATTTIIIMLISLAVAMISIISRLLMFLINPKAKEE